MSNNLSAGARIQRGNVDASSLADSMPVLDVIRLMSTDNAAVQHRETNTKWKTEIEDIAKVE